jgi:uncharacterized protein (TIGR00369 family)
VATLQEQLEVWREPVRGTYGDFRVLALEGLDRMERSVAGDLAAPPIHHLTGMRPSAAGPGESEFTMPSTRWWMSPVGYFPMGVSAFLADAPAGGSIVTALPPGRALATSDLTMNFLRPMTPDSGLLVGRSKLIHAGRSLALSQFSVEDGSGRLVAHGSCRCYLFDLDLPASDGGLEAAPPQVSDSPDPYQRAEVPGDTVPPEVWDTRSGLEVLDAEARGELPRPPVTYLWGCRFTDYKEGSATLEVPMHGWHLSPAGTVYGGAIALHADISMNGAVQTTIGPRTSYSPLDLKVNFLRPVFADDRPLAFRSEVIHRGRTMAVARCEAINADGKRVAVATESLLIIPDRSWSDAPIVSDEGRPEDF